MMIEDTKKEMERQRIETDRIRKDLERLQEQNRKESEARREESLMINKRLEELGATFTRTFREGERRREVECQVINEQIKQMFGSEMEQARATRLKESKI